MSFISSTAASYPGGYAPVGYADPVGMSGWAKVAIGLQAGAGIGGAVSKYFEGQAISDAALFNAQIARQDSELSKAKRELIAKRERRRLKRFVSTQEAIFAKAGVTMVGSPILVIEETLAEGELDIIIGDINASMQQSRFESQARQDELRAMRARGTGRVRAGLTLLETGAKIVEKLIK